MRTIHSHDPSASDGPETDEALAPTARARRLARYYDLDFLDVSYDAELYQQLAHEAGGPILELGVGSGRLAIPLALAGHRVVGIDHDRAMLERAREAWRDVRGRIELNRLTLLEADFSTFRAHERFGLALMAVNTFLAAEDDEARAAILASMRQSLRPDGIAVVEVDTPGPRELARYDRRLQLEWVRSDPLTGEEVSKSIRAHYDPDEETLELIQVFEWTPQHGGPVSRVVKTDLLHLVSAAHLAELAREAGFPRVDLWGDHLLMPYGAGSHRAICVARLV